MNRILYALLCISVSLSPLATKAQLQANFASNATSGCSPIVAQFTDQTTGGTPTSWLWDLGNGTTSTLQNPSTTYINPGSYTVTLTVSNGSGSNTKTVSNYITVNPSPVVNFRVNDSSLSCAPKTVQFTNFSNAGTGSGVTYLWDFGDGNTSNAVNPSHTYTTSGNFNVTLVVTNGSNCTKSFTKTQYIPVAAKPAANFTSANNNSCTLPAVVNFTNTTTGGSSYQWDFGDGGTAATASPSHTYTTAGSYNVRLIAINAQGCRDTIIKSAFVNTGNLDASFTKSHTTACINSPITFTNTSTPGPGNSIWYFGNGGSATTVNTTYAYPATGTYTVKLVVNYNNCADSAMQTVTVTGKPQAGFTTNDTIACAPPHTAQFNNTSIGAASYLWLFGDGGTSTQTSPSHTYTAMGAYTVRLVAISSNGCRDTFTKTNVIKIEEPNLAIVTDPASGSACIGRPMAFYPINYSGFPVTSFMWNFGDGTTNSTSGSALHTYTTPGTYTASFTYTILGCSYTKTRTITISSVPNASFSATPTTVCPGQAVTFTNSSTGATSYTWIFGDGSPNSNQVNPVRTYPNPGTYTVRLIASNNGCTDTMTIAALITVRLPLANFNYSINCNNRKTVIFQDISSGANTWQWNFGDGTPISNQQNPVHTFAANGTYNVTLTVTNIASGCSNTVMLPVTIFDIQTAFTANDTTICKGQAVTFSTPASSLYTNYKWVYGDGAIDNGTAASRTHTYTNPGTYAVRLVVTDRYNCKDSLTKPNYIKVGGYNMAFTETPTAGCVPLTVNFQDQSTNPGGFATVNRQWLFGDGGVNNGNNANISHTYTAVWTYGVKLIVTDANGCKDSLFKPNLISVNKPVAQFYANDTTICPGETVNFVNNSGGANFTSFWYFGDGTTSNALTPSHVYTTPGNYTVKMVATDMYGCKDSMTKTAYISVLAASSTFTLSDTFASCPPLSVHFNSTAPGIVSNTWTFGNGSQSSLGSPSTVYTYPGTYTVKLKTVNAAGCMDSSTRTIIVLGPTGTFNYTPTSGCTPLTVQFTATTNNTQSLVWDMNNGYTQNTPASTSTITYTYTQTGKYVPKLILTDGNSCLVPIQGIDTIKADHIDADFSFNPTTLCHSGMVQFTDTVLSSITPPTTRNWTFGDGGSSTAHNPSHTYAAPGTYTVRLVIGTIAGCLDTIIKTVIVHPKPVVNAGPDQSICSGQTTSVQLQASGAVSYSWSPATGLSCTNCPNPIASPTGTVNYVVTGTNANGCTNTDTVRITINTPPVLIVNGAATICEGASANLSVSGATSYTWSPAASLSCTNCTNPVATPLTTTIYTVVGSNNGCNDTAQVTVTVKPKPIVNAGPDRSICEGASVNLTASGAQTYDWSPATGLSCTNCANPTASPATTTTYTVTGTQDGCSSTDQVTVNVNMAPDVNAGNDISVCEGQSAQLQASGAQFYTWSPASYLSCTSCADPIVSPTGDMLYKVVGTDSHGCSDSDEVQVTVIYRQPTTFGGDAGICAGETTPLYATGGTEYLWYPAAGLDNPSADNPAASPTNTTTYSVVIKQGACFADTGKVTVTVHPLPTVELGEDMRLFAGSSVHLRASGSNINSYSWTPETDLSCYDCENPVATPKKTVKYSVKVTNIFNCEASDDITLFVTCDNSQLFVPNTFTPNGDGVNDRFYISGKGVGSIKRLRVFTRWGETVFSADNMSVNVEAQGWDGTHKGVPLSPDVFVYIIDAVCDSGELMELKGDISLIR